MYAHFSHGKNLAAMCVNGVGLLLDKYGTHLQGTSLFLLGLGDALGPSKALV